MSEAKYRQLADRVRAMVADGTYKPGQPVMSGAELARRAGCSALTGRKALRLLVREGVLVEGVTPNARHRVAGGSGKDAAARALSSRLASLRRAGGMTQVELAAKTGVSVTTVGHAETGRAWQSARFWEKADAVLGAGRELAQLHTAWQAARHGGDAPPGGPSAAAPFSAEAWPVCVVTVWSDGEVTIEKPPQTASRSGNPGSARGRGPAAGRADPPGGARAPAPRTGARPAPPGGFPPSRRTAGDPPSRRPGGHGRKAETRT